MREILESYLSRVHEIRASGQAVDETSYYGALETLLNEVGKTLKPRARCILSLQNRGGGLPDGGLFTPDQFQRGAAEPLPGQNPSRGVVEAKGAGEDARAVASGEQVTRYCQWYGQVLVTTLREFVLVGQDEPGRPVPLESYSLAPTEASFWAAAAHPRRTAVLHGEPLVEFLKRVMLRPAPIAAPRELAWFLASYARDARARMEAADLPALAGVRSALEEALGIQFQGSRGEHFFRSTLVQTLFYGIFAAWVLWCRTLGGSPPRSPTSAPRFEWGMAARYLRVPVLRKLFHEVADPGQLEPLGISEVLDWAGAVFNRVDRDAFFARFEDEQAVQYFYEPFLEAYDPELRKELGVWYTPPEIVHYMVERVDTALREELGIEDGLADPRVYVLDPCCGTGAYLVEVLRRIEATLRERGGDALMAEDLKRAALERVFGFEIMAAPFVVAHLQLGLQLQRLGAPLSDSRRERVGVYLTNALTGWEPPEGAKLPELFPVSFPGVKTSRDDVVVDIDRDRLVERMQRYFDPALSDEQVREMIPGAMENTSGFDARTTRAYLCRRGFLPDRIVRYCYRPFDVRWLYWEPETKLLDRNRAEYFAQVREGNLWLSAGQRNRKEDFYQPQFTRRLTDHHLVESNVGMFPLYLHALSRSLFDGGEASDRRPNLTDEAAEYLAAVAGCESDLLFHALAVLNSPSYRAENAGALRQDWPRVPLPKDREPLLASAELGRQLAALLDPEAGVAGVTGGTLRPALRLLGRIARMDGGQIRADRDLEVTAGWVFAGQGGATMAGQGKLSPREYSAAEAAALEEGAGALGLTFAEVLRLLGESTSDIYLNDAAHWSNVPLRVWKYTLGGYQVLKKWLSYRERELLGRALTPEEARYFTAVVRRIAAILLLEPRLNANYWAVKKEAYPWPG